MEVGMSAELGRHGCGGWCSPPYAQPPSERESLSGAKQGIAPSSFCPSLGQGGGGPQRRASDLPPCMTPVFKLGFCPPTDQPCVVAEAQP